MSSQNVEPRFQKSFHKRIRHPPCILNLLRRGLPPDIGSETAHSFLVRYVVTKGLSDAQGRKMAQTMMRNSVIFGSTREVTDVQKFVRCLSQARENPWTYCWNCEDIWSSKSLRERSACTGWTCEYYQARPIREPNHERSEEEASMEEEILTYLLNDPESITIGLRLGLRSEGFVDEYISSGGTRLPFNRVLWHAFHYLAYHHRQIQWSAILGLLSGSPEMRSHVDEIARYMQRLRNRTSCERDTFIKYLNVTNARGARLRAHELVQMAEIALGSTALPLEIVVRVLKDQSNALLFETSDRTRTFEEDLDFLFTNLFMKRRVVIPTPSEWLSITLDGGWKPGKLYAVTASCDTEATDFLAWCAEFAAQRRFPTLYVSYGISKEHFAEQALARLSGIDGTELSRYRENPFDSEADRTTFEPLIEAGERLSRGIAHYLTVVEGNASTMAALRNALRSAQNRVGADEDKSMLMILDQLPYISTDAGSLTHSMRARAAFGEISLLTQLKRHLRDFPVAIIAAFAGNKTPNASSSGNDETVLTHSLRNLKGLYGADYTLALRSAHTVMKGTSSEKTADQLHLAREWYNRKLPQCRKRVERLFDEAAGGYPLDETCAYTRISLFGRYATVLANPVIIYEWPYHRFRTLHVEPMGLEKHGSLSLNED